MASKDNSSTNFDDMNATASPTTKKSLYQRYKDAKSGRNKTISDEDMKKYTGRTKGEINEWAKTAPGVAGNQAAGKIDAGPATGFGGLEASQGYGGWGPDSQGKPKFPPQPPQGSKEKKLDAKDGLDDSD